MIDSNIQSPLGAITQMRKAGFPIEQHHQLKTYLNALTNTDARLDAGISCRLLKMDNYLQGGGNSFRLGIVSNFSYQPIADILRTHLLARGIFPEFYLTDYNQYQYELLDANSGLYRSSPELTLCLLDEHSLLDELGSDWKVEDIEQGLHHKLHQLAQFAKQYQQQTGGLLIFNTLPLSRNTLQRCLDYRGRSQMSRWWAQFNADLCTLSETYRHVFVIDTQCLLSTDCALRDDRQGFYARMLMSNELLDALANEVATLVLASCGMAKKCLVVDLDNTLWGGILGDDGIEGVQLSNTASGDAFIHLQHAIKQLTTQGVLLAISSKNNHTNVIELLKKREDMVLKQDDFASIMASWRPKSEALKTISEVLNIGEDSLVFFDDSAFEREEVRLNCPKASVIMLGDDPAEYVTALVKDNYFCQLELSKEDYQRSQLYRTEVQRTSLRNETNSLEVFLQELQIKLRLFTPQENDLARISQLSLRTNQFNMTTIRMNEGEVRSWLAQPQHGIIALQSSDRFGDYGIIGCLFYHGDHHTLWIDNFLLSCRVFSRQLETAALNSLLNWANVKGYDNIHARYLPTPKNTQIANFYLQHNFTLIGNHESYSEYQYPLTEMASIPQHIELITSYQETN